MSDETLPPKVTPMLDACLFADNLCEFDRAMHEAFLHSRKEYDLPYFTPRIFIAMRTIFSNGQRKLSTFSPLCFWISYILFGVVIFTDYLILLLPGIVFFGIAAFTLAKYKKALIRAKTNILAPAYSGFGATNTGLIASGMLHYLEKNGFQIKSDCIDVLGSLIKMVKAGHDADDTPLGIGDVGRKTIYSSPFLFIPFYLENLKSFERFFNNIEIALRTNLRFDFLFCTLSLSILWFLHDFLFKPIFAKKKRRQYLVMLNMIHEYLNAGERPNNLIIKGLSNYKNRSQSNLLFAGTCRALRSFITKVGPKLKIPRQIGDGIERAHPVPEE